MQKRWFSHNVAHFGFGVIKKGQVIYCIRMITANTNSHKIIDQKKMDELLCWKMVFTVDMLKSIQVNVYISYKISLAANSGTEK